MRNHLNRSAKIFTPPFLLDNRVINPAGSIIIYLGHDRIGIALIMAHIQICFRPIISHKNLAMLKRVHGAGINIDIRVKLLKSHCHSAAFK